MRREFEQNILARGAGGIQLIFLDHRAGIAQNMGIALILAGAMGQHADQFVAPARAASRRFAMSWVVPQVL